jgi:hypothetical protein
MLLVYIHTQLGISTTFVFYNLAFVLLHQLSISWIVNSRLEWLSKLTVSISAKIFLQFLLTANSDHAPLFGCAVRWNARKKKKSIG